MIRLLITEVVDRGVQAKGLKRYSIRYGTVPIVSVIAKNTEEAEAKFIFTLASGLQEKTIDFDMESLNSRSSK